MRPGPGAEPGGGGPGSAAPPGPPPPQAAGVGGAAAAAVPAHPAHDVPDEHRDAAEHDDERRQRGQDQAGDADAATEQVDRVAEGAAERVAGVHGGRRPVLLGHVDRQRAVGGGLAQRLDLRAELLDGQLDLVDAVLHGQHLVDGGGLLEEPDQAPLDGAVVTQAGLQVDELRGDVLARGGRALHVAELGEPLDRGVEQLLGHADDDAGVGVRAHGLAGRGVLAVGVLRGAGRGVVQRHRLGTPPDCVPIELDMT